ncbi:MAG: hypothetical protein N2596_02990, partial [Syntrophorhabdaceae bacterium]|nr:hypothetical protein [Syntrophorhabdaceae bacterium]
NLLKCAMSDRRIGMVTPLATNISNLQNVEINFKDFDDMQKKATEYNVSNPRLWHERLRLITIATLFKRECIDMVGQFDYGFFHDFVDDDITFRVRRAGYKAILCKDTFVHHEHDLFKEKNLNEYAKSLEKGKTNFREKYFGIDAWDDVNNYEIAMMSMVNPEEKRGSTEPQILGIDVLCGTPILELKNRLRMVDIFNAKLSAFTSEAKYYIDLKTICDGEVFVDRPEYLIEYLGGYRFDFIIIGSPINFYREPYKVLNDALLLLKKEGHLFLKLRNAYDIRTFFNILGNVNQGEGKPVYQISIEDLNNHLARIGYCIKDLKVEHYELNENIKGTVKSVIQKSGISPNVEEAFIRTTVRDYIIDITKLIS